MPRRIILDCDPGHDDAIALLLAAGSPDVDLVAVTTVAGNAALADVTRNALSVARIAGIAGIPFAAGSARPLVRPAEFAPLIHGESGLAGPELPPPAFAVDSRHAVQVIIDTVLAAEPGTITLVPTGPLTNIALAARLEPRIVPRVGEVVLMGGAVRGGNKTPTAEFNIAFDPEAAHIVFDAGWQVTMVGLDATHQALATDSVRRRIAAVGTGPAAFVGELLDYFGETYRREQGFVAPPVHDPCAVGYVIEPSVLTVVRTPLAVELTGRLTAGMTVADLRAPAPADCRTQVAVGIDADRFWNLVLDALERIGDPRH